MVQGVDEMIITKASEIKALVPQLKTYNEPCGNGLQVVVESIKRGGGKSFAGRMRFNGKQRTVWIGSTKKWTIKSARERFEEIQRWSKTNNKDPKKYKSDKESKGSSKEKDLKFLIDQYMKYKTDIKDISLRNVRRQLNQVLYSIDGSTPFSELEWDKGGRSKVMRMREFIESRGSYDQARRVQNVLCQVFNYGISHHDFPRTQNPAVRHDSEINKHRPSHNPAITWEEVPKFLEVVNGNKCNGGVVTDLAVKTLLMTFLRVGALCRMEWDWYHEDKDCWIIPSQTTGLKRRKNVDDKPHHIPMTQPLREVITLLRHYTGHQKYVFWSFRGKAHPHLSVEVPNRHLIRLGYKGLLTAQGWRQVPMSAGQDVLGFPPETIQRQMAHLLGDKSRKAYD